MKRNRLSFQNHDFIYNMIYDDNMNYEESPL